MNARNLYCQAIAIFFAVVCLASAGDINMDADNIADVAGSGNRIAQNIGMNANGAAGGVISQDADNRANVYGSGNRIDQNIQQNAGLGTVGLVVPGVIQPVSSLQQRIKYSGQWMLGPATACIDRPLDWVIRNNRNQYLRIYEVYPNGRMVSTDLGYHAAGELVYGAFIGEEPTGLHRVRARGSVSGWSNDIIAIQVIPCYIAGGFIPGGGIRQDADNWVDVHGSGNRVGQDIDQNAWSAGGGDIRQDADNWANIVGSDNRVGQDIDQNAWSSGGGDIWQDADNRANIEGSGNQVGQDIDQNAGSRGGGDIWQDADNWANVEGSGNQVDQDIDQNAQSRGGGDIWQDADNRANVDGSGNQVDQNIDQNAWA